MTLRETFHTTSARDEEFAVQYRANVGIDGTDTTFDVAVEQVYSGAECVMPYRRRHAEYVEKARFHQEAQEDIRRKFENNNL